MVSLNVESKAQETNTEITLEQEWRLLFTRVLGHKRPKICHIILSSSFTFSWIASYPEPNLKSYVLTERCELNVLSLIHSTDNHSPCCIQLSSIPSNNSFLDLSV